MPCGTATSGVGATYAGRTRYYQRVTPPGSLQTYETTQVVPEYYLKTTTGTCTPHYASKRRRGELIPHTYFWQRETTYNQTGTYDVYSWTSTVRDHHWYTANLWFADPMHVPNDSEHNLIIGPINDHPKLIQAAYANAYGKFDALTFAAELSKTVQMFRGAGKRIVNLLDNTPRRSGSAYLEARYGWRQIYFDLKGLNEAVKAIQRKYQLVTGRAGNTYNGSRQWNTTWDLSYAKVGLSWSDSVRVGMRGTAALRMKLNSPIIVNPALTAWELLTYSFIVDWFVNVGQSIEALSAYLLSTESTASSGYSYTYNRSISALGGSWKTGSTSYGGTISSTFTYEDTVQVRQPGRPSFLPQVEVRLDQYKILDLVAIVGQRFGLWARPVRRAVTTAAILLNQPTP